MTFTKLMWLAVFDCLVDRGKLTHEQKELIYQNRIVMMVMMMIKRKKSRNGDAKQEENK